jgi:hypothetical protein
MPKHGYIPSGLSFLSFFTVGHGITCHVTEMTALMKRSTTMNKRDPKDLIAESRRWICYPDDQPSEPGIWRLRLVIENESGFWFLGILSNDPTIPPPPAITAASHHEAVEWCKANAESRGISSKDYDLILSSSMRINRCNVVFDSDTLKITILDFQGDELLSLSEDEAKVLFYRLEATFWPYGRDEDQDADDREMYGVEGYSPEYGLVSEPKRCQ